MIPKNITKDHIKKALKEIDKSGVPKRRESTRYSLEYEGKLYPPKYVVSIANEYANGKELGSKGFNDGAETNNFLKKRGFKIRNEPTKER